MWRSAEVKNQYVVLQSEVQRLRKECIAKLTEQSLAESLAETSEETSFENNAEDHPSQDDLEDPNVPTGGTILKITLAQAYRLWRGGTSVPSQPMQILEQSPLSDADPVVLDPEEEELRQKSARFKKAKEKLDRRMSSARFKKGRASMQEEVDFECDQPTSRQVDQELWVGPEVRDDQLCLGSAWEDHFFRDRKARRLAVMWLLLKKEAGWNPRTWKTLWEKMTDEDVEFGRDFKAAYEESVKKVLHNTHKQEWNTFMKKDIESLRRRDELCDYKLALLICYNEDLDDEEAGRMLAMLDQDQAYSACDVIAWLRAAPQQEGWRRRRKPAAFSKELRHEIRDKWDSRQEGLKDLYSLSIESRRDTFHSFYVNELQSCGERFRKELWDFKAQDRRFRGHTEESVTHAMLYTMKKLDFWKRDQEVEFAICRKLGKDREKEIREEWKASSKDTFSPMQQLSLEKKLKANNART
jgi:hypothetical protein